MEFGAANWITGLRLMIAALLFLLPGWLLSRRLSSPAPILTAFLGSSALLFQLVLVLALIGVPLDLGSVVMGFIVISAAVSWRSTSRTSLSRPKALKSGLRSWEWFWLVPPAVALVSIAVRAIVDPLSGYDNSFRWDYLAHLLLANHSLDGYPPLSTHDFEVYAWCDGIPPLVPLLNFWIYDLAGSTAPTLTAIRVIGEALLLGTAVYRYSRLLWGDRAGWPALAALSSSSLLLWGIAMGQETGLTAISLVSMLYFLELNARNSSKAALFWAGVSAGVGGLSREYGLSFFVLGLGILIVTKRARQGSILFVATSLGLAAPWYVRNWSITGNPLYPQTLGGIFSGNAIHDEVMKYVAEYWSIGSAPFAPTVMPMIIGAAAGGVLMLAVVGAVWAGRRGIGMAVGIILVGALWLWSLPQTAGGWVYSARVLVPAIGLCAVLSGWIALLSRPARMIYLAVLTIAGADAARRSWLMPVYLITSPWSTSFAGWTEMHQQVERITAKRVWEILVTEAHGRKIVVDQPMHHATVTALGGRAVPLFSPLLHDTFDDHAIFSSVLARLRKSGVRFIVLTLPSPITDHLINHHRIWKTLCSRYSPTATVGLLTVFDLENLAPIRQASAIRRQ